MGIYGQDWASYQSTEPSVSGLDFVFTKITEGLSYISPKWTRQRDHAKKSGLVWGAYHYPHMANDPKAEADYFLKQVAWQPGDIIVLDWEGYDNANTGVSKSRQLAYKEAWLRYVKAKMPNNPVGMYANTDYWRNVDTTGYYADFLWIATAGRTAGDPGIAAPWLFHQYGDNPVDKDYCHLTSRAALRSWAMAFAVSPTSNPNPEPTAPAEEALMTPEEKTWFDGWFGQLNSMAWGNKNDLAALLATNNALVKLLSADHDLDAAAVGAAVKKAVAEALAAGTVDVDVTVHDKTTTTPKAS
ncbi:glycoside hydrolase family 25 protein [Streptomyces sp. NPDC046161]|uniref:glycoside hydrolase family 25 protein n=1 Tax=Streptomyces sp. NPDC046161 TaxID=3155132 RepID=UPI0033FFE768